jgi:tRNA(Ile)-lysidine synthetase-like protein
MLQTDSLYMRVRLFCEEQDLFQKGDRVLLSLSAGKDSMAVFHFMRIYALERELTILVFHLNHGTRGAESDADEIFVRDICEKYEIIFISKSISMDMREPSFEEKARNIRYSAIHEIVVEEKCSRVVTAHTMSDNNETVLMRFFTGTHIHGLAGIPAIRGAIVRPLWGETSGEIIAFLERNGYEWREDPSNNDPYHARNFVRHEVLPIIESKFPNVRRSIHELSVAAIENDILINELLKAAGVTFYEGKTTRYFDIGELPITPVLFGWIMSRLLRSFGEYSSRERCGEGWKRYMSKRHYIVLYESPRCIIERDTRGRTTVIRIIQNHNYEAQKGISGHISIRGEEVKVCVDPESPIDISASFVDYKYFTEHLKDGCVYIGCNNDLDIVLRKFECGDRILINGSEKKVKYLMNDHKCSVREKVILPMICIQEEIVAVPFSFIGRGSNRISDNWMITGVSKKILAIWGMRIENER